MGTWRTDTEQGSSSGYELWGRGLGEGGDRTERSCPELWSSWRKGGSREVSLLGASWGSLAWRGTVFLGNNHCETLRKKRGSSQGKDQGEGEELRLWDKLDLGSSLALPLTKYVTLGKLVSQSLNFFIHK